MNSKQLALTFFATFSFSQVGCQNESRPLTPAPVEYGEQTGSAKPVEIRINPQVDIIFVIDDSGSMREHQANLARNIDHFVEGFAKNSIIDPHIGVMTVWDSDRYGFLDIESEKMLRYGVVPEFNRHGERSYFPLGELRPLKGPSEALKAQPSNYIIKAPDFIEVLRESLKVGVSEFERKTGPQKDAKGPELEEVFTPLMAALLPGRINGANKGFLRKNSHLVVVFVTDANDASIISADQMYQFLQELKGRNNFSIFGVLSPSAPKANCRQDNSGPPLKIEKLIYRSGGTVLNMCSNYAAKLAEMGQMVQDRTVGEIQIPLKRIPVLESIELTYGSSKIPQSNTEGWSYDGENVPRIIIRGAAKWTYEKDAKILLKYEPVNPARPTSHCIGCQSRQSK